MSNHHVPFAGFAAGALALGLNSFRSTSALTTNALLLTPKYEYAACKPYSFSSPPFTGLLLASVWKYGSPNVSDKSLCDVIKNGTPAFAFVVPLAVPVPAAFCLSCFEATKSIGVVPGSAGV